MSAISRRTTLAGALTLFMGGAALLFSAPAKAGETHDVTIADFAFEPAELTISAGDSVRFTNNDGAPHDATADDGAFETARLGTGDSATLTFDAPGVYEYHCSIHPAMQAVIIVE